jgi:DNA ligase (NAD+)
MVSRAPALGDRLQVLRPKQVESVVEDIVPYVGPHRTLTPVAHLTPTKVAGSTVARATLHNLDEVRRKDIRVGDHVILQKAGDVIPEVVRSLPEKRTGPSASGTCPRPCPVCGSRSSVTRARSATTAPIPLCPARVSQEFGNFVGGMDIEGAGWKTLEQLLQTGSSSDAATSSGLSVEDLEGLDRFGRKSAENLHANIQKAKRRPLERIIASLGIPQVGETTAIDLARWSTIQVPPGEDWLRRVGAFLRQVALEQPERFEEVEGVGPTVAAALAGWFADDATSGVLGELADVGVDPEAPAVTEATEGGPLAGRTVVVTGTIEGIQPRGSGGGGPGRGREARRVRVAQDGLRRGR